MAQGLQTWTSLRCRLPTVPGLGAGVGRLSVAAAPHLTKENDE